MKHATKRLLLITLFPILVITSCSERAMDYCNRANAEKAAGDFNSAERDYQKAVQIDPNYAEAHNNFGAFLLQRGRLDEAMVHFQKALQLNPDYAEGYYNFGLALVQKGRVNEAIDNYHKALKINPGDARFQKDLDNALALQKKRAN